MFIIITFPIMKDIPQKTVIAPTQKSSRKKNDYGIIVEGIDNT